MNGETSEVPGTQNQQESQTLREAPPPTAIPSATETAPTQSQITAEAYAQIPQPEQQAEA